MSCRVDTAPLLAGACVVSLYAGHGVRGDQVPSTGTHGPSPIYNDLALPGDAAKEYRWAIVTPPASGSLVIYEDGSYAYTPPGGTVDLTASYTYRLWQDGTDLGTATESIVIGAGSGIALSPAALTTPSTLSPASITYTPPGAVALSPAPLTTASALSPASIAYTPPAGAITISPAPLVTDSVLAGVVIGYVPPGPPPPSVAPGYTLTAKRRMMSRTVSNPGFDPKDPAEVITLAFDFAALTTSPSSPVVTATRHAGTADSTPEAIISGDPLVSGTKVLQKVVAGTAGTDYLLRCQVDAPDGSRYVLAGVLPVRTA